MELTEPIDSINTQLVRLFGIDSDTARPMFRVVESWSQYEKRLTNVTPEGIQLTHPKVQEVPKYDQRDLDWKDMYILERLVVVPVFHEQELPTSAMSYEPLWVFKDAAGKALPPAVWACKFVIDTMYAALGKKSMKKYVDEEAKNPEETREKRISGYINELFGDESALLGRTITGEAVGYTGEPTIQPVSEGDSE